jgi:glucan biosynthesis protein C
VRGDRARMTTPARHHGLDAARAFAMMLVLSGHAMVSFTVTPVGWAIQDRSRFLGVDLYAWVVRAFAMPTFFWLAGYFGRALLDGAGLRAFARNRVTRIFLPLAVMLVPVSLALSYLWDWGREVGTRAAVADNIPKLKGSELEILLGHLWFLYYLLWLSLAAVALRVIARRVRVHVPAIVLPLVVTTAVLFGLGAMHTDTPLGFIPDLPILVYMGAFFGWGWLVQARPAELARYTRHAWHALALAPVFLAVVIATLYRGLAVVESPPAYAIAASALFSIACMIFLLGACVRYLDDRPRPLLQLASRASYWCYILHIPVAVFFQILLADVPLFGPLKYLVILATTTAICLGVYALGSSRFSPRNIARSERTVSRNSAPQR